MLLFVEESQTEILAIGIQYLHIEGAFYVGIGLLFLLYGLFRGFGRAGVSIVLTVVSLAAGWRWPMRWRRSRPLGLTGVWWSVPIGWALADITGFALYWRLKRRLNR